MNILDTRYVSVSANEAEENIHDGEVIAMTEEFGTKYYLRVKVTCAHLEIQDVAPYHG